jgi:hypothetical protein
MSDVQLTWEVVISKHPERHSAGTNQHERFWRAKVPGGWFVQCSSGPGEKPPYPYFFYPDPNHEWQVDWDKAEAPMVSRA